MSKSNLGNDAPAGVQVDRDHYPRMTVVKANASQAEELADLNRQLLEDERHTESMTRAELAARMASWLQEDHTCYVARRAGVTVGYCLFRDAGRYFYLRQLFIARSHRRRGLATALLDWMYAHVWDGRPVRLDVFAHNEQAVAFYQAYGFRVAVLRMERRPVPRCAGRASTRNRGE